MERIVIGVAEIFVILTEFHDAEIREFIIHAEHADASEGVGDAEVRTVWRTEIVTGFGGRRTGRGIVGCVAELGTHINIPALIDGIGRGGLDGGTETKPVGGQPDGAYLRIDSGDVGLVAIFIDTSFVIGCSTRHISFGIAVPIFCRYGEIACRAAPALLEKLGVAVIGKRYAEVDA